MESRFDLLAKVVAGATSGVSRREALRRLGGAAAGAALALVGIGCDVEPTGPEAGGPARPDLALGGCKKLGKKSHDASKCCSGFRDPDTGTCACAPGTLTCLATGTCLAPCDSSAPFFNSSTCQCQVCTAENDFLCAGTVCCAGVCCGEHQVCSSALTCVSCNFGESVCSGVCTNTTSDPFNCGSCNNACTDNQVCQGGLCVDAPL